MNIFDRQEGDIDEKIHIVEQSDDAIHGPCRIAGI